MSLPSPDLEQASVRTNRGLQAVADSATAQYANVAVNITNNGDAVENVR